MAAFLIPAKRFFPVSVNSMVVLSLAGAAIYGASMLSMMGLSLVQDVKKSLKTLLTKAG